MKVVQINTVCGHGSTGNICVGISKTLTATGIENYIISSSESSVPLNINCGLGSAYIKLQALRSRILGNFGFNSGRETKRILQELESIAPDVVHLHNVHGHDCNLETLFNYFREKKIKVFWTFHDCWAFTGYCTHFTLAGCDKWKSRCYHCPQYRAYSWFFDRSEKIYLRKKRMIDGVDVTVITPSDWLASLVRQSFFRDCRIVTVHNGIDLDVFKPTTGDFRKNHGIREDQHLILGVAAGWSNKKGLDVFIELARILDSDQFRIVLVGTTPETDKTLPKNIISVHRTENQTQLAEIYTAADLFVNPTREEVLGMVNLEALACGTPVLSFKTGGCPECINDSCGAVVDCDDVDELASVIRTISDSHTYSQEACIHSVRTRSSDQRQYEILVEMYRALE